jgi:uncharacterized protein (DUF736 family)
MAMELDNNTLVLFPNGKKEEGDNMPDYKGEGMYEGVAFEIGLWKNISKAGRPYLKGKLGAPFQGAGAGAGGNTAAAKQSSIASDAPPPY